MGAYIGAIDFTIRFCYNPCCWEENVCNSFGAIYGRAYSSTIDLDGCREARIHHLTPLGIGDITKRW